jgi:HEAT repeat protein
MDMEQTREPEAGTPRARVERERARRLQTGIRGLIVAVACFGVIVWAGRSMWETWHPTIAAARGLGAREPSARTWAVREVMTTGVNEPGLAIPPLLTALGDPAPEVRAGASEGLGLIGGESVMNGAPADLPRTATAGLIRSLKDREPSVRLAAVNALIRIAITPRAAGAIDLNEISAALAEGLGDPDDQVRLNSVAGLARCGPLVSNSPPAALVATLEDRSAGIRAEAIKALASFPCPLDPWLSRLFRGLVHEEREVRRACWAAIGRDKPPAFSEAAIPALLSALKNRDRIIRFFAARALEPHARDPRVARDLIPALLAYMKGPMDPDTGNPLVTGNDMTLTAARLLGELAPGTTSEGEVVAVLAEAVRSGNPSRQQGATDALGHFGAAAEPAVPALMRYLREVLGRDDEAHPFGGFPAASALMKIAPGTKSAPEVVAVLAEAMRSGPISRRAWAIEDLGKLGPAAEPAVPVLIQALRQPPAGKELHSRYEFAVARVLGQVAPGTRSADAAIAALTEALGSPGQTRLGAIYALSDFGPRAAGAVPQLRAWQNDPDGELRRAASSALNAIEGASSDRGEENETKEGQTRPGPD